MLIIIILTVMTTTAKLTSAELGTTPSHRVLAEIGHNVIIPESPIKKLKHEAFRVLGLPDVFLVSD